MWGSPHLRPFMAAVKTSTYTQRGGSSLEARPRFLALLAHHPKSESTRSRPSTEIRPDRQLRGGQDRGAERFQVIRNSTCRGLFWRPSSLCTVGKIPFPDAYLLRSGGCPTGVRRPITRGDRESHRRVAESLQGGRYHGKSHPQEQQTTEEGHSSGDDSLVARASLDRSVLCSPEPERWKIELSGSSLGKPSRVSDTEKSRSPSGFRRRCSRRFGLGSGQGHPSSTHHHGHGQSYPTGSEAWSLEIQYEKSVSKP